MGSRWRAAGAAVCAGTLLLQGCYENLPMQQGTIAVAERVLLTLNDQGRVGMAGQLGPAVDEVEGAVLQVQDSTIQISVNRVTLIGGNSSLWNGERVNVRRSYVAAYAGRRLSRTRTALLVGGITAGMLAFVLTQSLLFGGGGVDMPPSVEPGPISLRATP